MTALNIPPVSTPDWSRSTSVAVNNLLATARGLGTMSTQNANAVAITGGTVTDIATFRVKSANPVMTLRDDNTAGANATGSLILIDSASATRFQIGKPFSGGAVYFDNTDAGFEFTIGGSRRFFIDTTNSRIDAASGYVYRINSQQVLKGRIAGWGVPTGTVSRVTYATYTAPAISATPTQAEVQALANHVQTLSRTLGALIADLHATAGHGIIGT